MRPDLADELAPSADGDNSPFIQGNNDGDAVFPSSPPNAAASAISAATKKQNDDIECISGCKDTDQSCRARCLGVPGVAARKTPRKQDISGNLPLNWRKHSVAKETGLQNSASVLQFSPMLLVLSCLEAKHADAVQLHRSSHDSIMSCLGDCATSKCRDDCFLNDMSDEEIVRRTQRCTESCKDEPEELVQMCIQKCSYYLMDPVGHDLDEQSITDSRGLLPDTPHVRTRIRLIGPDGLPIISTVEDAAETATPTNSEDSANTTSSTWTPVYRVHIISGAGERLYIWWGYYLVLVICLVLHLE
ncbi:hypothetical protein GGI26_001432 [Coemansia sp. RSA 1358]|nr:hypothetical protein GGI26_001432 [Coemansia sp. RSA 1358]